MKSVRFGDLCKLQNGRAFKPEEWSEEGTPIVRIQNLNDETKPFNYCNFDVENAFGLIQVIYCFHGQERLELLWCILLESWKRLLKSTYFPCRRKRRASR